MQIFSSLAILDSHPNGRRADRRSISVLVPFLLSAPVQTVLGCVAGMRALSARPELLLNFAIPEILLNRRGVDSARAEKAVAIFRQCERLTGGRRGDHGVRVAAPLAEGRTSRRDALLSRPPGGDDLAALGGRASAVNHDLNGLCRTRREKSQWTRR